MKPSQTAILRVHCPDHRGIVASVSRFLSDNNANIISLDQHVDHYIDRFFMRAEWPMDQFAIPQSEMSKAFQALLEPISEVKWKLEFSDSRPNMAIFVSKYAHCFYDILSRYESGEWKVNIPLIISNHEKFAPAAQRLGIPYYYLPITAENKEAQEAVQLQLLKEHNVDFIVLARYMQVLSEEFIQHYPNKIINIHHSSLPAFAGARPYESAYHRGVKFMGATAHYVTADLDEGPIITQDVSPISHKDSIEEMKRKGKDIEKIVLAKAIWEHINANVITYKNKTVVFE